MTETIYTTEKRHPQSTKLFSGRPLTKGNYATRAELEEVVLDRYNRGYGYKRISRVVGVSDVTVANIIKRWTEKQNASSL